MQHNKKINLYPLILIKNGEWGINWWMLNIIIQLLQIVRSHHPYQLYHIFQNCIKDIAMLQCCHWSRLCRRILHLLKISIGVSKILQQILNFFCNCHQLSIMTGTQNFWWQGMGKAVIPRWYSISIVSNRFCHSFSKIFAFWKVKLFSWHM